MRVDQVITLVWAGNLALLGGTGWVGWRFWQQKKATREVVQTEWPEAADAAPVMDRWPGAMDAFQPVWKTPLDGLVPPPPKPVEELRPVVETIDQRFRKSIKIVNAVAATNPAATMLKITNGGKDDVIALGQLVDDWQLVSVRIDRREAKVFAGFSNPNYEKGVVVIEAGLPDSKPPGGPGETPLIKTYEGAFDDGDGKMGPDSAQAFLNPETGEWDVPPGEAAWWGINGTDEVLKKTTFVSRPEGLEVASMPPRGPLNNTRGVTRGDIIVSINGVAVKSLDEVFAYLRGEGRQLSRYAVVIERDGARRTQVYNVARRRAPVARTADASGNGASMQPADRPR